MLRKRWCNLFGFYLGKEQQGRELVVHSHRIFPKEGKAHLAGKSPSPLAMKGTWNRKGWEGGSVLIELMYWDWWTKHCWVLTSGRRLYIPTDYLHNNWALITGTAASLKTWFLLQLFFLVTGYVFNYTCVCFCSFAFLRAGNSNREAVFRLSNNSLCKIMANKT